MHKLKIEISKQDNSIKRLEPFIYGYVIILVLLIYGLINNIIQMNSLFIFILTIFIFAVLRQLLRTIKHLSNPVLYFFKGRIEIKFMKYGILVAKEVIKKEGIEGYQVRNNSTFLIQGFSVSIEQKDKTTDIGLVLKEKDAIRIEKEIKNWL